jgi:hypothetical protein
MQHATQSMKQNTNNGDAFIRVREQQIAGVLHPFILTKYRTIAYIVGSHARVSSTSRRLPT